MIVLETARTLLRPFTDADAPDLYAYAKDPRVGPAAGWRPHGSVEESLRIIHTVFSAPHVFAVVDRSGGHVVGSVGFVGRPRDEEGLSDELGYALSPAFWGRGLMTEVAKRLLEYGFTELGMKAIWCSHYEENDRSRRVIEKCGFTHVFDQRLSDEFAEDRLTRFYVLLREDWERGAGR